MNLRQFHFAWRVLAAGCVAATLLHAPLNAQQPVPCLLHGRSKLIFLVQPERAVRKGEALAVFHPEAALQALRAAETAVQESEAKIRKIEADLAALILTQQIKRAPLVLEQEEAARVLERYQLVDQPLNEKRLQQAVADADLVLTNEEEQCESRDELLKQGAIRKKEWDEAGLKVQRAKLLAETARANLGAHVKYEKGPQTSRLTEILRLKESALENLDMTFEASKKALKTDLETIKATIPALQAAVVRQQEQLNQTAILAPTDGIFRPATEPGSASKLARGSEVNEGQLLGSVDPK